MPSSSIYFLKSTGLTLPTGKSFAITLTKPGPRATPVPGEDTPSEERTIWTPAWPTTRTAAKARLNRIGRRSRATLPCPGQLGHRDQDPLLKSSDSDFPEPGAALNTPANPRSRKSAARPSALHCLLSSRVVVPVLRAPPSPAAVVGIPLARRGQDALGTAGETPAQCLLHSPFSFSLSL